MEEGIKFNHFMPAQIRFSDVDQFGHVNNSVYFSLYDLAKTTHFKDVLDMEETTIPLPLGTKRTKASAKNV